MTYVIQFKIQCDFEWEKLSVADEIDKKNETVMKVNWGELSEKIYFCEKWQGL